MERILRLRAESRHFGRTLKQIMQKEYGMSAGLIARMKQSDDAVLVNGTPQCVNYIVREGDEIIFTVESEEMSSENLTPTAHPVEIIFEDEDILAINKPAYLPCHPVTGNYDNTLSNYLAAYYLEQGKAFTARVINRLDSNTSGLVLFAKNALAAGILNDTKNKSISKEYTAITLGIPSQKSGEICTHIRRKEGNALAREVCSEADGKRPLPSMSFYPVTRKKILPYSVSRH
jgi:23S rRNA pseudouridine1911/1915/1917 synthase